MPRDKYVPKHRAPGRHKAPRPLRAPLVTSSVAVLATGGAVAVGSLVHPAPLDKVTDAADELTPQAAQSLAPVDAAPADGTTADGETSPGKRRAEGESVEATQAAAPLAPGRRKAEVSRSADRRALADPVKQAALTPVDGGAMTVTEDLSDSDPREVAKALMPSYGFSVTEQFSCLDSLYVSESNWRVDADNPSSSAYGIPQAMTSMHDLPADYYTSAESQLRWGLEYIQNVYGTPCAAWSFKQGNGWY